MRTMAIDGRIEVAQIELPDASPILPTETEEVACLVEQREAHLYQLELIHIELHRRVDLLMGRVSRRLHDESWEFRIHGDERAIAQS